MMVTYVRGHFKNVSGSLVFDPENPAQSSADVTIDAGAIWTGQSQRDAHLRSADFLDVEHHPRITFTGHQVEIAGARDYILRGALGEARRKWHRIGEQILAAWTRCSRPSPTQPAGGCSTNCSKMTGRRSARWSGVCR